MSTRAIVTKEQKIIARGLPLEKPSARIKNSLKNILNGGVPVIAKIPMRNITPVTGIILIAPLILSMSLVLYFRKKLPAQKNNKDFTTAWLKACRSAP